MYTFYYEKIFLMRYVNDVKIYIENRLSRDVKLTAIYIIQLLNVCLFLSIILIYSTLINIAFRCLFQLIHFSVLMITFQSCCNLAASSSK